ncbi:MAG: hypothetical protein H7A21_12125 [Spirochaetales bacterium]|nr:hypothetical protein [Leptospiraceae bacterium]MCP5482174.1 hypothetical protein [Spirochaetales bacterium]MCP5484714.1 hypothetical protein [Spirochaetales bacterium]
MDPEKLERLAAALTDQNLFLAVSPRGALAFLDRESDETFVCAFTTVRRMESFLKRTCTRLPDGFGSCDPLLTSFADFQSNLRGRLRNLEVFMDPAGSDVRSLILVPLKPVSAS